MSYFLRKVHQTEGQRAQNEKFVFMRDENRIFDVTLDKRNQALKVVSCMNSATKPIKATNEDISAFEDGLLRAYITKNPHINISNLQTIQSEIIGPGITVKTNIKGRFGNIVLTNGALQRSSPDAIIHTMDDLTITPEFTRPKSIICHGSLIFTSPLYARREPALMDYTKCDIATRHLSITGSRVKLGPIDMGSCRIQLSDVFLEMPEHLESLDVSSSTLRLPHHLESLRVDRSVNLYEVSVSTPEDTASFVRFIEADTVALRKLSQRFLRELTVSARKFYPNADRDKGAKVPYVIENIRRRNALDIDDTVMASFEHPISRAP